MPACSTGTCNAASALASLDSESRCVTSLGTVACRAEHVCSPPCIIGPIAHDAKAPEPSEAATQIGYPSTAPGAHGESEQTVQARLRACQRLRHPRYSLAPVAGLE